MQNQLSFRAMSLFLTIAIPTYNRASYLKETLEALKPHLANELEVLVVDNGSTDETPSLLEEYEFVRVIRNEVNQGFDFNIIRCLREAKGGYVAFFGDDDLPTERLFENMRASLKKTRPKLLYLNHFPFFGDDIRRRLKPYFPKKEILFSNGWDFFRFAGLGHISSLVVERSEALHWLSSVKEERMCAHFDIAGRMALTNQGPFLFQGNLMVAGRTPLQPRYVPLEACVINQAYFWRDVWQEGLIDRRRYRDRLKALLIDDLMKMALKARLFEDLRRYREPLDELFHSFILYRLFVKPLYGIPRVLLFPLYAVLKSLLWIKRYSLARSLL